MPNPFTDVLKLNISTAVKEGITLTLSDLTGRHLLKQVVQLQAGVNILEMPEAEKLAAGSYLLTMQSLQQTTSIRILKAK